VFLIGFEHEPIAGCHAEATEIVKGKAKTPNLKLFMPKRWILITIRLDFVFIYIK
jgi:hypothetical protein